MRFTSVEDASSQVPTHISLIPEKHRWRTGDECLVTSLSVVGVLSKIHGQSWEPCDTRDIGRPVLEKAVGRRPIPEEHRKALAERLHALDHGIQPVMDWSFEQWCSEL